MILRRPMGDVLRSVVKLATWDSDEDGLQLAAGEREIRGEQHPDPVDRLQGDPQNPDASFSVGFHQAPGFGGVEVGVHLLGGAHGRAERRPEFDPLVVTGRFVECGIDRGEQRGIDLGERSRSRDAGVAVLVGHRQHPIDEIAPGGNQLLVDPSCDLLLGDLGVGLLGQRCGQREADGVGLETCEPLPDGQPDPPTGRGLAPLERDVLVGRHVGWQVQPRWRAPLSRLRERG